MLGWILFLVAGVSLGVTGLVYRYAQRYRLLDIPGARSSHQHPTPRGGGLGIVFAVMTGVLLLLWGAHIDIAFLMLLLPGVCLALLGLMDDRFQLGPGWRFLAQTLVALACLWMLGGVPWLTLPLVNIQTLYLAEILMAIFFVWYLNLYNFMDGINGIASLQAITVGLGSLLLIICTAPGEEQLALYAGVIVAACVGFLPWNFPRAKIFMGDVGSLFCGYLLYLTMLLAGRIEPALFWALLTLSGVFVVDATFTLLRRAFRGEAIWQAHRLHAYQKTAHRWGSHTSVSLTVAAINLFWLLPMAWLIANGKLAPIAGVLLAYGPLVILVWLVGAGKST